jgi:two-component system response regulator CpxR
MKPKRTILCVDDNDQSLSYRKIMLETRGYRVASYSRGEDALERFKQGGIDLVVTDMAMPGLDGPQLIAAIKHIAPYVPAILISSKVRVYDHDSQADVFLTRGMYAPADLLERIRLLAGAQARPQANARAVFAFPFQGAAGRTRRVRRHISCRVRCAHREKLPDSSSRLPDRSARSGRLLSIV